MRSPYEDLVPTMNSGDSVNTMPYHARENSQPFSYGQPFSYSKTSTPLRNGRTNGQNRVDTRDEIDSGTRINTSQKFDLKSVSPNYNNTSFVGVGGKSSEPAGYPSSGSTIKAQPRLTSPLLVRKTLNSRSPTRNTTNTISNTYHYSYNRSSNGVDDRSRGKANIGVIGGISGSSDEGDFNGNISSYGTTTNTIARNNVNNANNNNNKNNYISDYDGESKSINAYGNTSTRYDFEELLRERRQKVYNEYRSTAPPSGSAHVPNALKNQSKYNFDFEFNLNLDEFPSSPRRSNTMDRAASLQYRTHDIPMAANALERNYHTISSSAARDTREVFIKQDGEPASSRPPLEHHSRRFQQETTLIDDRYGNENGSGYNSHLHEYGPDGGEMKGRSMSPIYATSAKQKQQYQQQQQFQINSRNSSSYRSSTTTHDINRGREPESTITDFAASILVSPNAPLASRPETPAFPVTPRTPYGTSNGYNSSYTQPRSPTPLRVDCRSDQLAEIQSYGTETIYQINNGHGNNNNSNNIAYQSRLNSSLSLSNSAEPQEVAAHLVKFAKDSSQYWYKPNLTRDEAIALLLHAAPGTFIIRDSTTYKNAYGLVLRVAQPPPGSAIDKPDELVRHFLIEPTTRGVRLKGCANEPVFTSLSALVYEHSINALALPCTLLIPEQDLVPPLVHHTPAQRQLLTQGAACNVLWLYSCDTESLTGEEAIRKAIRQMYAQKSLPTPTEVHFKVSQQGITLTDNTRKKFFRKHYVADMISFCAIDPDHHTWTMQSAEGTSTLGALKKTIFAFVARKSPSSKDNQCHVFCDLAINQPASAIVSFANKTLPTEKQKNYVL